jgi:hypothetical protein
MSSPDNSSTTSTTGFSGHPVTVTSSSSATDEEEEVREEDTANAEVAPPSAMNSPAPTVSTTDADDASKGMQDDNSDGGDETGSP